MRRPALLSASILLLAVAVGCHAGRGPGEVCAETADCAPELACFNGKCATDDGSCRVAGKPCDRDEQCCAGNYCNIDVCEKIPGGMCIAAGALCTDSKYCCAGLTCQNSRCGTAPTCKAEFATCVTSLSCCAGLTCSRFGPFCQKASALALGEPCTADSQCRSRTCRTYCTKPCTSGTDCTDVTECLNTTLGFICVPFCRNGTDCTVYGAGFACQQGTDPNGLSANGCFAK